MSGKITSLLGVICIILTAVSCSTTGFVWDNTLPPEQSAKIWFLYFTPKTYNGVDFPSKVYMTTLPAGNAEFSGDIDWYNDVGNIRYHFTAKDVVFSYNLEGGKEYSAVVSREHIEGAIEDVWGIGFYRDIKTFIGNKPPKDRLVEFIPFQSQERERTIFQ